MNENYRNGVATHGGTLVTYIGLVDNTGVELSGGDPAYARQPVTWTSPVDGLIRPTSNLLFDIPAGDNVAGWRGYSALTGGVEYGGKGLTQENFAGQGIYALNADETGIEHN